MDHHSSLFFRAGSKAARGVLLIAGLVTSAASQAVDFGPFSLNGFAKAEVQQGSNQCVDCQRFPGEERQRIWADELVIGKPYGTRTTTVTLAQPYLGVKFDLGRGFKLAGLISQRWRDGKIDIDGWWYDKNIAVSHEEYGSLRVGSMTTRAWSIADYPYGTNVGVADPWGSSGAGYGLLGHAARYTFRPIDFLDGDLVLEGTYDSGPPGWKVNKPQFVELYAQYVRGDLVVDAMYQDSRNGQPVAWGHAPFAGLTPFPADDSKLGGSGQSMAMVMARYQVNAKIEVSGGLRRNRWSGAYAIITVPGVSAQWNSMFNVDWNGKLNGVANPGYPVTTTDLMLGLRDRMGAWTASTAMVYLSKGDTSNPSERGQSNAVAINTVGLNYAFPSGFQLYGMAGLVNYARIGLAPMSMPSNIAFTNVDPRVTKSGNWFGLGAVYAF